MRVPGPQSTDHNVFQLGHAHRDIQFSCCFCVLIDDKLPGGSQGSGVILKRYVDEGDQDAIVFLVLNLHAYLHPRDLVFTH